MHRSLWLALSLAAATTLAAVWSHRAQAQPPAAPDLKAQGWKRLTAAVARKQGPGAWGPRILRHGTATTTYRLDADTVVITDADDSGDVTVGDVITAEGVLTGPRGTAGIFEFTETFTRDGSVGTLQLAFNRQGTIVVGGGTAFSDGTRSGTPVRAILGGTGSFSKSNGQVGYVTDGDDLFVILGVR